METQESTEMIVYRIREVTSTANINIFPPSFLREEKISYNCLEFNSPLNASYEMGIECVCYVYLFSDSFLM